MELANVLPTAVSCKLCSICTRTRRNVFKIC